MSAEKVAIKVLQKSKIKEAADVERVSREIKILKRVNNDQVIRLFEVLDTPQAIYLIMEFCEGGELFDYIVKHTRIKEPVAVRFFHQIIDGLDYLHKVNVIHRDLKPENLLMQRRPEGWHIKIVDFGLSNTNEGNKLLKTACGSPCYAAPEMIAGDRRLCSALAATYGQQITAKVGAEGVYGAAFHDLGLGLMMKCRDGNRRAIEVSLGAIIHLLFNFYYNLYMLTY